MLNATTTSETRLKAYRSRLGNHDAIPSGMASVPDMRRALARIARTEGHRECDIHGRLRVFGALAVRTRQLETGYQPMVPTPLELRASHAARRWFGRKFGPIR